MRHILIYLCLMAAYPGVQSEVQLVQSGAEIKKPGESVKISCKTSGFTLTEYYVSWIRQTPGKGLLWLGGIDPEDGDTLYDDSVRDRVSISTDKSINTVYLQFRSLRTEDTDVYYCVRGGDASGVFDYWGQGTLITVTSASNTAPSVFPLTSCTGNGTMSQVTFGCLAKGYFPEPVTMTWSPNVGSSGVKTYPSILQPSSGLYSLSSQVTITDSSLESDTYTCTVQHQPTRSSISKEIPKSIPIIPKVKVLYNCNTKPGAVELVCFISGFYPKNLTVEWLVDGVSGILKGDTETPKKDADGRTFSTRSNASVSQSEWLDGKKYTCKVFQPDTGNEKQGHASKCEG